MLPVGVVLQPLAPNDDDRGTFTELFRNSWSLDVQPAQWNVVRSVPTVLRGVHAHWRHADYLTHTDRGCRGRRRVLFGGATPTANRRTGGSARAQSSRSSIAGRMSGATRA